MTIRNEVIRTTTRPTTTRADRHDDQGVIEVQGERWRIFWSRQTTVGRTCRTLELRCSLIEDGGSN